jgi:uncharacterized protein (DUF58 family)
MERLRRTIAGPDRAGAASAFRSLYFNRVWIAGAALTALIGVMAEAMSIALLGALMLASAGVATLWNQLTLTGVELTRSLDVDRAFPNDIVRLTLKVANRKPLPVPSLRIDEELGEPLTPEGRRSTIDGTTGRRILHLTGNLRPYARVTWNVPLTCRARGAHRIGPATIRSGDPFGFFASRSDSRSDLEVLVYPRVHAIGDLDLPTQRPVGEQTLARTVVTDPMRVGGIRDYRPEDPFRSIHWKATARLSRIQVKVQEPVTTLSMMILLNLDTFEHVWEGLDIVSAEQSIEVAASYATWGLAQRYAVGLRANGVVGGSDQPLRIPAGRGNTQQVALMTGLARLRAYSTLPFSQVVAAEMPRIPLGCTVVVITPMMSEPIESLLAALLARGRRTVLVPLGDAQAPALPGLVVREFQLARAGRVRSAAAA